MTAEAGPFQDRLPEPFPPIEKPILTSQTDGKSLSDPLLVCGVVRV